MLQERDEYYAAYGRWAEEEGLADVERPVLRRCARLNPGWVVFVENLHDFSAAMQHVETKGMGLCHKAPTMKVPLEKRFMLKVDVM